jgi:hypothetical protein
VAAGLPPFLLRFSRLLHNAALRQKRPRPDAPSRHDYSLVMTSARAAIPPPSLLERSMLANNVVPILMTVFTLITLSGLAAWVMILVPRQLGRRKQRQIAQLVAGAELLADAIARNGNDAAHLARLSANYAAHVRALNQLGQAVPAVPGVAAPLARAA